MRDNMNSFNAEQCLKVGDTDYTIYSVSAIAAAKSLPFSIKIILENLLRHEDGNVVTKATIDQLLNKKEASLAIDYSPARVIMQDFTAVPAVVDLAAMRHAMPNNPEVINPVKPTEIVIDHSVQVDNFGDSGALQKNIDKEFERNRERYQFLHWGQKAFNNFTVVPPGMGIVHQVNLEKLARVVFQQKEGDQTLAYPDTVIGTDSHTTMVNGIGVLGWGVGGIEAESVMLGQPISMLVPKVVGCKLTGKLNPGVTATDLALTVTEMLRKHGVVGKFVEYYGSALAYISAADRSTIANMAPEYGATCGIFPVDEETLNYLRLTGRDPQSIDLIETYYRHQGMFYDNSGIDSNVQYDEHIALDLSSVVPSLAGPKRPQDRIPLRDSLAVYTAEHKKMTSSAKSANINISGTDCALQDGAVVIAAITSCTNTSNPSVMVGAGLVAKKAAALGIKPKPWVKTSFGPGSQVVSRYLQDANLLGYMEQIGFNVIGYGCTTCIGNSGPLITEVGQAITDQEITTVSVLSGNRNFEGRVHPQVKMNFLASPPLVVVYALAGTMNIDINKDAIATSVDGKPVYLADLWPSNEEIAAAVNSINSNQFSDIYKNYLDGSSAWQALDSGDSALYQWDEDSTYIRRPSFFDGAGQSIANTITNARALAILGDSVTTDHISPAGSIADDSPAARYLQENGVDKAQFNSYGSRRGNHEVMMRGTFANIRLRNKMVDKEGGYTLHVPSGELMAMYDAAMRYEQDTTPVILLAGKEYGTGSSRDWAAKGTKLLGVQAVIAESFERIHRSNLVGMGILPLEFILGQTAESIGLTGLEEFTITGIQNGEAKHVQVVATHNGKQNRFYGKCAY